ncbi:MAG TPA: AAA family ATPase [Thermoanaerobaculia bacterium]|jgi:DNA repair exonuclease SbcCD ATPase subunit|nr:AAA family ATPase [Thermoanaerobaculia bacterium]
MRLHRLRVQSFAAIREMDIAFGPGLNVLYGPNDLGKSTLADAIRLALLLPCTFKGYEPYIPWSGAADPLVELTFETEAQRFWRVRKQFDKRGTALLQESRNGQDFDDVERGRSVDAKLREILRWGISEPGGSGAGRGLPESFLATALLSTQSNVSDILGGSLQDDSAATGKDQIAAALQAVAQDPLFVVLLREAQGRRDEAYTDRGAKKTARGSVFTIARDRVKETREEKERLEKIVEESEGVERHLRELVEERSRCQENHSAAAERLVAAELLEQQAANRAAATEHVRIAREAVLRIQKMDQDIAAAERRVKDLAGLKDQAERALKAAQAAGASAGESLTAADEAARSSGLDSEMADTVARQALELRKVAAEQSIQEAGQRIAAATTAQDRTAAVKRAEEEHRKQEAEASRARETWAEATGAEQAANGILQRCDLLERGLETRTADKQVVVAQADVEKEAALQTELTRVSEQRSALAEQRGVIDVPPAGSLVALRKLERELASARGALDVGLVMTVIPTAIVNLRVRKDGVAADPEIIAKPLEIEANTEVEVEFANLATVRVQGGRREAQEKVRALESRWDGEALPHLTAAGASDLEALEAKVAEARELDSRIQSLDGELESLRRQITTLAGAAEALRGASERAVACRLELGDETPETLAADLDALGSDPGSALRARRQKASRDVETARKAAQEAATIQTLAEERARGLRTSLEEAVAVRDAALAEFPLGAAAAMGAAEEALRAAQAEQKKIAVELASLQNRINEKKGKLEAELTDAREAVEKAGRAVEAAQESLKKAITDHATEEGRLSELKRLRDAEDLTTAESGLRQATERHDALPVTERLVSPDEVTAAKDALAREKGALEALDREVHTMQGALQQVGGAVARDHLHGAMEAFELAESLERETEAEYEAWRLLLDQMKEAEAAQESNLGQALAPAIADRFQALTLQRYQSIQLTPYLGTEGVVVAGAVRSPERISVGTREQLSTLYRLCLGEYLQTTIVLDDQLVQSDDSRMEWFRALLAEKARSFQIIVFTCRPGDYLAPGAMVAGEGVGYADSDEGFVRSIDLGRAAGVRNVEETS